MPPMVLLRGSSKTCSSKRSHKCTLFILSRVSYLHSGMPQAGDESDNLSHFTLLYSARLAKEKVYNQTRLDEANTMTFVDC